MVEIIKTLNEILDENQIVFCDSGVENRDSSQWLEDWLYDIHSYSKMDPLVLENILQNLCDKNVIFNQPKVHTVDKIAEEIARFRNIVLDKKHYLDKEAQFKQRNKKSFDRAYASLEAESAILFQQICNELHVNYALARKNAFVPRDKEGFNRIEKLALEVAKRPGVKIDFSERYGSNICRSEDLHTDERIVAASFYMSAVDGKSNAIITPDSDIRRIAQSVHWPVKQLNPNYEKNLRENPLKIYFLLNDKNFRLTFTTATKIDY